MFSIKIDNILCFTGPHQIKMCHSIFETIWNLRLFDLQLGGDKIRL